MHPAAAAPESSLSCLPRDLLQRIFRLLKSAGNADQHALRCVCRATRDMSTPLINQLCVQALHAAVEWADLQELAMHALARFPSNATLTKLRWSFFFHEDDEDDDDDGDGQPPCTATLVDGTRYFSHPELLPAFLLQSGSRLTTITHFTLETDTVINAGDMALIAIACPHLQSLKVDASFQGPVFAPLRSLKSLKSLELLTPCAVNGTRPLVLESLAQLTQLTQLTTSWMRTFSTSPSHKRLVAAGDGLVDTHSTLLHMAALTALRHLNLSLMHLSHEPVPSDTGHEAAAQLSSLSHLTSLVLECRGMCNGHLPTMLRACAPNLVTLRLQSACLTTDDIRFLTTLPRLSRLDVKSVAPDCDLSGLVLGVESLWMPELPHAQQLLWLPRLPSASSMRTDHPFLKLPLDASQAPDQLCDLLRAATPAIALFVGALRVVPGPFHHLTLSWNAPAPSSSGAAVLSALQPLQRLRPAVQLTEKFALSADVAKGLGGVHARSLIVPSNHPDLLDFLPFLAPLGHLRSLYLSGRVPVSEQVLEVLSSLAVARVATRMPLAIICTEAFSEQQRARLQSLVDTQKEALGVDTGVVFNIIDHHWF